MSKILVCLLFKNSNLWLDRFFDCIEFLLYEEDNKKNNLEYEISIIYGDSNDGTEQSIKDRTDKLISNNIKVNSLRFNPPDKFKILEKLAILRNTFLQINDLSKYDYLLMVDTDIIFEPRVIIKLIKDIENPKLESCGIVAPMIFIEDYGFYESSFFYDILAYRIKGLNFRHHKPYIPVTLYGDDKYKRMMEVDSVGSLYLIKSNLFVNYDIHYGTYLRNVLQEEYESEQVYLCEKIRQNGFKIYVDMNMKVFHVNLEKYGLKWH